MSKRALALIIFFLVVIAFLVFYFAYRANQEPVGQTPKGKGVNEERIERELLQFDPGEYEDELQYRDPAEIEEELINFAPAQNENTPSEEEVTSSLLDPNIRPLDE